MFKEFKQLFAGRKNEEKGKEKEAGIYRIEEAA